MYCGPCEEGAKEAPVSGSTLQEEVVGAGGIPQDAKPQSHHGRKQLVPPAPPEAILSWLLGVDEALVVWVLTRLADRRMHIVNRALGSQVGTVVGRDQVHRWLVDHNEGDVHVVLADAARDRPGGRELLERCAAEAAEAEAQQADGFAGDDEDTDSKDFDDIHNAKYGGLGGYGREKPMVGVASRVYFTYEADLVCTLEVVRTGNTEDQSIVTYRTRDLSAKAGWSYVATTGQLVFEAGEITKELQVPLIRRSSALGPLLEFKVALQEKGLSGAVLDRYMSEATIRLVDDECRVGKQYEGQLESRPASNLMRECVAMLLQQPSVRKGATKLAVAALLQNLCFALRLVLVVYALGAVLMDTRSSDDDVWLQDRERSLLVISGIVCALFFIVYLLDLLAVTWDLAGTSRSCLRNGLFRRYLNLDEHSRTTLDPGRLVVICLRDVELFVSHGILNMLELLRSFGNILMLAMFYATAPSLLGLPSRTVPAAAALLLPALGLTVWAALRLRSTAAWARRARGTYESMVAHISQTLDAYRTIVDYGMRSSCIDAFETLNTASDKSSACAGAVMCNNTYFIQGLAMLTLSSWTALGGRLVLRGELELGVFLTDVLVLGQAGWTWDRFARALFEMLSLAPPCLEALVHLQGLRTELQQRADFHEAFQEHARMLQPQLNGHGTTAIAPSSLLSLRTDDAQWSSNTTYCGVMELKQGQLYALVGSSAQGKAMLLKLLSGALLPQCTEMGSFVPPNLRVLYVSWEPFFFRDTLLANLCYGVRGKGDAELTRVAAICRRLQLDEAMVAWLERVEVPDWSTTFSVSQRRLLMLVRALVANPEVLCLHTPTQGLGSLSAQNTLQTLQEFVRNKGLEQDPGSSHLLQPRTCLFTCSDPIVANFASKVVYVSKTHGIKNVAKEHLSTQIFG